MPNITISLSKPLIQLIDDLCKEGKCATRYAYVKKLVEDSLKKEEKKEVERGKESERENSGTDGQVRNQFEDID